tara:strand:+ start:1144 stop:2283 length:1140 start_codon:yes stop_codon:yes gene_type:complete
MSLELFHIDKPIVTEGYVVDAWWVIRCDELPPRYVRLIYGKKSLLRLVFFFGIMDVNACVNSSQGDLHYMPIQQAPLIRCSEACFPFDNAAVCAIIGVRQRTRDSGICWFGSVCFGLFYNEALRDIVISRLPTEIQEYAKQCLTSPEASEKLRESLWRLYAFGDNYDESIRDPQTDGQNGMTQIIILLAQLGIPMKRFFVTNTGTVELTDSVLDMQKRPHKVNAFDAGVNEASIIIVRFRRGAHATNPKHRPARRIRYKGRTYFLISLLIGSEHCGHQIAGATPDFTRDNWSTACVDACRYGILPFHWSVKGVEPAHHYRGTVCAKHAFWWSMWGVMVPVTFFSGGQCNLSPHNARTSDDVTTGRTNVDFLYLSMPPGV